MAFKLSQSPGVRSVAKGASIDQYNPLCYTRTAGAFTQLKCHSYFLTSPKLAPAIMILIKRDNHILLARGPHFPEKFYSVLAGFVDPGETLEQCVAREVFEEVGLTVENIRYFGSQPWPFSHSLMIRFTCKWQSGDIQIDSHELVDAAWFDNTNLPQLPPSLSLSRIMIDAHFQSFKNNWTVKYTS